MSRSIISWVLIGTLGIILTSIAIKIKNLSNTKETQKILNSPIISPKSSFTPKPQDIPRNDWNQLKCINNDCIWNGYESKSENWDHKYPFDSYKEEFYEEDDEDYMSDEAPIFLEDCYPVEVNHLVSDYKNLLENDNYQKNCSYDIPIGSRLYDESYGIYELSEPYSSDHIIPYAE